MIRIIAAAAMLVVTNAANANWQYTTWGMSVAQVTAASHGQFRPCDQTCDGQSMSDGSQVARLYSHYRSGDFSFIAFALFDRDGLSSVHLNLTQPNLGNHLAGALTTKYGRPVDQINSPILHTLIWRDQTDQISVTIIGLPQQDPTNVSVNYQPRVTTSNKGL